jgi:hypothetical protein
MGIEEGEEVKVKGTGNIFHKIIAENFLNLKKDMPIQVQETSRIPNRHIQNITSPQNNIVKIISRESKGKTIGGYKREKSNNI